MRTSATVLRALATVLVLGGGLGLGGLAAQQAKLTASDGAFSDRLGFSVAVSGDTAVAGAFSAGSDGAAYVFRRTGSVWAQEGRLVAGDPLGDGMFGISAAVDGDTVVIGADYRNLFRGAAYVFTRSAGVWTQQAKLTASDAAGGDKLGISVAISGDTAVAGAYARNSSQGAVYVFTRTGTVWTQQATLTASDGAADDQFGNSVAIEGDTVVVGAQGKSSNRGAVYVFTRSGLAWTQRAKLANADSGATDQFGSAVALSQGRLLAGAQAKDTVKGAAYVFAGSGSSWTQEAKLVASDAANFDRFGGSVALSGDTAVIGAYGKSNSTGAGYVFRRSGTDWTESATLAASDAASNADLGFAIAVSGDTAVAGAWGADSSKGAAYVFSPLGGAATAAGYCVPAKVAAKVNAKHPEKSTLTVSGTLDTGGGAADFSGAAAFDIGAFHVDVPEFTAKGKSLTFRDDWITLTVTPAANGSSRAQFGVKVTADLSTAIDRDGPLTLRFKNAAHDLSGRAKLTKGSLGPHCLESPDLCVLGAAATIKGAGKDTLKLTLGFVTDGVVPAMAEDVTIGFGGKFASGVLPASSFVRKRNAWVRTAKAPGITSVSVDHAKGTISIAGSGLDLGAFTPGGNPVTVTITRGSDTRTATIRMALAGTKLGY